MSSHAKLVGVVEESAREILSRHGLKGEYLTVRELRFPHGRADVVLYGLCEGVSVMPIAVEVRREVVSGVDILATINEKMRGIYDYAFTHVYIAVPSIRSRVEDLVRMHLSELGYGLLKLEDDGAKIVEEAKPKKPPGEDYYRVASQGVLYLAVRKALKEIGLEADHISSEWIGYEKPINYCGWLSESHAVFGIYARDLDAAEKLLNAADLTRLADVGYRTHIEVRFVAVGRTIGNLHLCDEPLNERIAKDNMLKMMKALKNVFKPCGVGFSIYKPLWNTNRVPSYPWALNQVRECLSDKELGLLKGVTR